LVSAQLVSKLVSLATTLLCLALKDTRYVFRSNLIILENTSDKQCLDTRSELESCGGCAFGYADITAGATAVGTE
jgi:hypothetical protein